MSRAHLPHDDPAPLPAYGRASLADLLPSLLVRLGVQEGPAALALPAARRYVLLLVDGLGANLLMRHASRAPYLSSLPDARGPGAEPFTTVFPATTPVALTSLGTGLGPGEHGLTGLYLRREDGSLLNTLYPGDVDLAAFQPRPTAFEIAARAGVAVSRVGPRSFDGDGLTQAGLRGGAYLAGESMGERVAAVAEGVRRGRRSLVYAYVGDLDATGHRRGLDTESWRQELTHVDRLVEQLSAALPADAVLLVTADHGMVDVPIDDRTDLASTPTLDDGVEVLAGDPRALHVHTRAGASEDVLATWRAVLGERCWLLGRDEAISAGWFGPTVAAHVRPRIGDVVGAAREGLAVVDSRVAHPQILALRGLHGSLTDDELLVPLLAARPSPRS